MPYDRRKYKDFIGPRAEDGRVLSFQARKNPEKVAEKWRRYAPVRKAINFQIKLQVLAHYGPDGRLCCNWESCEVVDPDMLTIDHVNNDGAEDRRSRGGKEIYRSLLARGYPEGYQTLCHNHQWKKEMRRRRGE